MNSYNVTSEMAGYHRKRGPLRVLFTAGFFAAFAVLGQTIWPAKTKWGFLWSLGYSVICGVVLGILIELFHVKRHFPYALMVSDDCITEVHPTFQTSVRKDELKTVTEFNRFSFYGTALRISKYGRFGTLLRDRHIWIPKALPEYATVRDLVLSWKDSARI